MIHYPENCKSIKPKAEISSQVRFTVESIIADIELRGDAAVREYSEKFYKWSPRPCPSVH